MRQFWIYLIVSVVWAAVYLPGLGSTELKGEEGRRILPARRMMQTGDYVLTFSEGRPYHRKPPGVNWAIAGSFRLLGGESEFAARLPSAVSVLLLALTAVWAGRVLAGSDGAVCLPLAVLTMFGVLEKGRLAEIEAIYLSLTGIGTLVWLARWRLGGSPWSRWIPAGIIFGLASFAKGPVFLPLFYAIAGVVLWKSGTKRELWRPAHLAGLALALLLPLPWAVLSKQRLAALGDAVPRGAGGGQSEVWLRQITSRLAPENFDFAGWIGNPLQTLLLLSPWALLAIVLWRPARRRWWALADERERALLLGLGWGILAGGLVYALLPEGRARFQMPLVAPVAALCVMLTELWRRNAERERAKAKAEREEKPREEGDGEPVEKRDGWRWWSAAVRLLMLLVMVAAAAAMLLSVAKWLPAAQVLLNGCVFAGAAALLWLALARASLFPAPRRAYAETAALTVQATLFYALMIIPVMAKHENVRPAALRILEVTGPEPDIAAFYPGPQPFLFYLGPKCVEIASIRQLPQTATHVVIPVKRIESPEMRDRLARHGFSREVLRVEDDDGTPYALFERDKPASP